MSHVAVPGIEVPITSCTSILAIRMQSPPECGSVVYWIHRFEDSQRLRDLFQRGTNVFTSPINGFKKFDEQVANPILWTALTFKINPL